MEYLIKPPAAISIRTTHENHNIFRVICTSVTVHIKAHINLQAQISTLSSGHTRHWHL